MISAGFLLSSSKHVDSKSRIKNQRKLFVRLFCANESK
ncbi:unnamed protein product [Schistosoma curassoni]|uniref:Uncharacterized protein n=1 Tax=Schistosoma curassoni TaxID=6186 RepID=A0A183L328_9TREM|nr:unnamed protein product [Schistosoma curassoni]